MTLQEMCETKPKSVTLLGLGISRMAWGDSLVQSALADRRDEVWVVNYGMAIFRHDKVFLMDDMRYQAERLPAYGKVMREHDRPIITSTPYPEFPMSVRYPIEEIVKQIGDDLLNNTVPYAIAYAMCSGVKDIWLYGCDYHYPNSTQREEGGQAAAYLLGMGRHFGMTFHLPEQTTFMGAYTAKNVDGQARRPLYGYIKQPFIPEEIMNPPEGEKQNGNGAGRLGIETQPGPQIRASTGNTGNETHIGITGSEISAGDGSPTLHPGR